MSSDGSPQAAAESTIPSRRRSRTPPKWFWIVLLLVAASVAVVRGADLFGDHAFAQHRHRDSVFVGFVVLAVWFLFLSGYRWRSRLLVSVGCVAGLSGWRFCFGSNVLTGELLPIFVFRFSAKPDRLLELPPDDRRRQRANVDFRTTTEDDFPGFLGPQRSESVEHVKLARDWTARPPGTRLAARRSARAGRPSPSSTATR